MVRPVFIRPIPYKGNGLNATGKLKLFVVVLLAKII